MGLRGDCFGKNIASGVLRDLATTSFEFVNGFCKDHIQGISEQEQPESFRTICLYFCGLHLDQLTPRQQDDSQQDQPAAQEGEQAQAFSKQPGSEQDSHNRFKG